MNFRANEPACAAMLPTMSRAVASGTPASAASRMDVAMIEHGLEHATLERRIEPHQRFGPRDVW